MVKTMSNKINKVAAISNNKIKTINNKIKTINSKIQIKLILNKINQTTINKMKFRELAITKTKEKIL